MIARKVAEQRMTVYWFSRSNLVLWEKALDKVVGTLGSNPGSTLTSHNSLIFLSLSFLIGKWEEEYWGNQKRNTQAWYTIRHFIICELSDHLAALCVCLPTCHEGGCMPDAPGMDQPVGDSLQFCKPPYLWRNTNLAFSAQGTLRFFSLSSL